MRDFGDDVFEGTAKYYVAFRPKYPPQLFDDIAKKYKLDSSGSLLDLGCGTGELAIPLAKYFNKVLAIDPDKGMLAEGRKKSSKYHISNIKWQKGSSKTLKKVEGSFKLVTMGQSFHWMDGEVVLRQLYRIVESGGGVAIVGTAPIRQNALSEAKNAVIKDLITKYLGPDRRAGKRIYKPTGEAWETQLFPKSDFASFEKKDYIIQVERNIDQIVGNLFSMSWASKKLLGPAALKFEKELKRKLTAISHNNIYFERVHFNMYLLSTKQLKNYHT
jgi:ubiquinone/menaquinone biosynthesis C-methylase UbiE